MGNSSSKAGEGKLKPDNISTVSMALEAGGQAAPTKPSRGNNSSRQQKPGSNGASYNLQPPPPPSSSTALSKGLNGHFNAGSAKASSRPRGTVMDFNGNHFYPANQHSLGKASTASSSHFHPHTSGTCVSIIIIIINHFCFVLFYFFTFSYLKSAADCSFQKCRAMCE